MIVALFFTFQIAPKLMQVLYTSISLRHIPYPFWLATQVKQVKLILFRMWHLDLSFLVSYPSWSRERWVSFKIKYWYLQGNGWYREHWPAMAVLPHGCELWRHDLWLASICDCGTICDHIMLQFVTRHDLWPKVLQFVTSVIQWF